MTGPSMEAVVERPASASRSVTVLLVTVDDQYGDRVDARVGDDDGIAVRRVPSVASAITDRDTIDCLVVDTASTADCDGDPLERVRRQAPDLPVVVLTDSTTRPTALETGQSDRWVEWLARTESSAGVDRLRHRIRTLVERRRLAARSRRSLAGLELAGDAIAIVTPADRIEFANRAFAMQFGYGDAGIGGRPWQTLFTDDSVDRLETTAIPTVADGWRWTGTCTGRRRSGSTFPVRVRLGGAENDGLVFVVEAAETAAGTVTDDDAGTATDDGAGTATDDAT